MPGEAEFMMPVPPEGAAMQFFIEALRANTEVLRGMQTDLKEDRKLIADVRERVIRIEANRVDRRVEGLEGRVNELESDKDHRDGATGVFNWFGKHGAGVGVMLLGLGFIIYLILKATGKIQ